ncbi:hypothetical protein B0H99_10779 [Planomicrobium soli]|uniref:PrpF protein n=1 Tax=Planomicrobium soli TaxID=1176648 RepID=A0A2P8GQL6_9BACL|nr:PrpF domain-containing protein [Planomicrobium soli]PSL36258.1 hypothetical protein B0H99_10779 [Planomicrobium soli]
MFPISQTAIPCSVYRGGTSRGLFFHDSNLPSDEKQREQIFLSGIDAYNPSQVNGLGSGTSHTSKVIVISEPTVEGADLDYTFYQIGIGEAVVDAEGTCGNLMAAVGAYAIDEGLIKPAATEEHAVVLAFNRNIGKMIKLTVPLVGGKARVSGDYQMPGLVQPGAKFTVDILSPGGGVTEETLPLGAVTEMDAAGSVIQTSFADIVNPFVFAEARSVGVSGPETTKELSENRPLMDKLEAIRIQASIRSGMVGTEQEAKRIPSIPKVAIVLQPHDYFTSDGRMISAEEVDIVAKMVSMGKFHRTFAGSGLYNLAASALLPGTVAHQQASKSFEGKSGTFRIGHPEGVALVRAALTEDGRDVESVGLERTARLIMKGLLYVPEGY